MWSIKEHLDRSRLRAIKRMCDRVNAYADDMASLSDSELQQQTESFKARYAAGESLDSLLPEAYAAVREGAKRVLGMYPYDVQVMGAIVLHQGNVAEMKTGEGKTLMACMPIYLNALTGRGVIMVTVNGYLSKRDEAELGPLYEFMGLTIASGVGDDSEKDATPEEKRAIYHADIVYTTNADLGFDYLIHNLAASREEQFMRDEFYYVIIDEVDAVLLDGATSPLVISGVPRVQSNLYRLADNFVKMLQKDIHYHVTEERDGVWLLPEGIREAERYFRLMPFYHRKHRDIVRHVTLALKAHHLFTNEKDYIVNEDNEVELIDLKDGRVLKGVRLQSGQHQAIEAKEHAKITDDNRSMASITYQNLFLMFEKIAGMTGTGKPVEDEMIETYQMEVVSIPTHRPVIRRDLPDNIYRSFPEKLQASINFIKERHATGQPLLIATGSVRLSELYSTILLNEGIPHSVLNAYNAAKEAEMIAEAGQWGSVTVATAMAGRGTDIKLGEGVKELGGLFVIGTERMMSERIDLQLRGRAGRQGDPGMSKFFVSLEDELILKWGPEHIRYTSDQDQPNRKIKQLSNRRYAKYFKEAQEASDGSGQSSRASILQMDDDLNMQREQVYKDRDALMRGGGLEGIDIHLLAHKVFTMFVESIDPNKPRAFQVERYIYDEMTYHFEPPKQSFDQMTDEEIVLFLEELFDRSVQAKRDVLATEAYYQDFIRKCLLKAIDASWIEEVDYLTQLKSIIQSRSASQRNPMFEYQREAMAAYRLMREEIYRKTVKHLCLSDVKLNKNDEPIIYFI